MTKNIKFAVELAEGSTGRFYKQGLMDKVINKYPWLTVAGLDDPFTLKSGKPLRGVEYAGAGNVLTFGTAKNHDVNWVQRADYARERGYAPVLDIVKDWNKITAKLDAFAAERKPKPVYSNSYYIQPTASTFYVNGQKVEVFENFFKIGYNIIPRTKCGCYTSTQLEAIKQVVITIKY